MPNPPGADPSGVLNLHKPIGVTSRDVVNQISRPMSKVKVGHAGTLDPLASGVLVVCLGAATRLIEYIQRMPKTYRATILLGATSETLDADGTVVATVDPYIPTTAEIKLALASQVGTISQIPPQFSALRVAGKRAYDLARQGQEVVLEARPVEVYRADLVQYEWPRMDVEIECGSGTYIRSIARDVGEALGCGGLIGILTRTRIGGFLLEEAIDPDEISREEIRARLRPAIAAVASLPRVDITAEELAKIRRGQAIESADTFGPGEVALIGPDGSLAAIGEAKEGTIAPRRVLAGSA